MSPSMVLAPSDSSSSSGLRPAMVAPFDPPMRGLPFRSASLGLLLFWCFVMAISCARCADSSQATLPRLGEALIPASQSRIQEVKRAAEGRVHAARTPWNDDFGQ